MAEDGSSAASPEPEKDAAGRGLKAHVRRLFDVSTARGVVTTGVIVGLIVIVLGPLVSPLPSIPLNVIHAVYIFVSGQQDEQDLHDAIVDRPFWAGTPHVYWSALSVSADSRWGNVTELNTDPSPSSALAYHSITDLISNTVTYVGFPTEMVGRVVDVMTLSNDATAAIGIEFELTGTNPQDVAYVGVVGDDTPSFEGISNGQIVAVHGAIVASGIAKQLAGPNRQAIYVAGFDFTDATTSSDPTVSQIVTGIEKAHAK